MIVNFLKCCIEISKVKKSKFQGIIFSQLSVAIPVPCSNKHFTKKKNCMQKHFFVYNVDEAELSFPKKHFFLVFQPKKNKLRTQTNIFCSQYKFLCA